MAKRQIEEDDDKPRKKRKIVRRQSPLQEFRKQTIDLRKKLLTQRKECDIKLRQIARDLGVLKRRK